MTRHVEDMVLRAFLAGDVDEGTAVEVALHLDECPACTSRVDALDPFLASLSALPDPVPPPDLVQAVLAQVEAEANPARASRFEIGVGAVLLIVAAGLAAAFGDPIAAASRIGRLVDGLSFLGAQVALAGPVSVAVLSIATLVLAALSQQARIEGPLFERRTP